MQNKEKILWILFAILVVSSLINFLAPQGIISLKYSSLLILYVPVILALLHSIWTLSVSRSVFFILLVFIASFLFEYFGLKNGNIFGGEYIYSFQGAYLLSVPVVVLLYWWVFIYMSYSISNSLLYWRYKNKPAKARNSLYSMPLLILSNIFVVVAIDLFMDPLKVRIGDWSWVNPGLYFGIPLGNFFGWGVLTFIVITIFRLYEYYYPASMEINKSSLYLIPIFGYTLLLLSFINKALFFNMYALLLIGTFAMLPVILVSLYYYLKFNKSE